MREIQVRRLTSQDWRQRDSLITERMNFGQYSTKVVRRCTYKVETETALACTEDSIEWASSHIEPTAPRRVFVKKDVDPDTGMEKVVYKVLGHIYAVHDKVIFRVGFRHILSMDVEGTDIVIEGEVE